MDFHYIPTKKETHYPTPSKPMKNNNKRLTQAQARLLETSFTTNQKLQSGRKLELAAKLGLSQRQVAVWYQNRRARQRTQTIELDYRAIRIKLEDVLEDKRRLEKEVGFLKDELNKAQQMLFLESNYQMSPPQAASLPGSISESGVDCHASSSELNNCHYGGERSNCLEMEVLYNSLSPWP
ncbi:hypothetical protein UlMin_020687 [Ulmus minor]